MLSGRTPLVIRSHALSSGRTSLAWRSSATSGGHSSTKRAAGAVLFGGLVCGTAGLGSWQLYRYQWKVGKIDRRKVELRAPPAPLDVVLADKLSAEQDAITTGSNHTAAAPHKRGAALDAAEASDGGGFGVRRIVVAGVWEPEKSMLIGRRGAPDGLVGEKPQGLATSPSGYFLCTSLRLLDDGNDGVSHAGNGAPQECSEQRRIVVNRGWMPAAVADAKGWDTPTGRVVVTGLLVDGEPSAAFSPPNDPASGTMLWLELPVLADALGVGPLAVKTGSGGGSGSASGKTGGITAGPVLLEILASEQGEGASSALGTASSALSTAAVAGTELTAVAPPGELSPASAPGPLWFVPGSLAPWRQPTAPAAAATAASPAPAEPPAASPGTEKTRATGATKKTAGHVAWPLARGVESFEKFPVMPETHAVYAATWLSLSAFGLAAAAKLLKAPNTAVPMPPAARAATATAAATAAAAATAVAVGGAKGE